MEDYLDSEFHTVCEDGSVEELAELFLAMKRDCEQGNFQLVEKTQSRKRTRVNVLGQSRGVEASGDFADEDEEDGKCDEVIENEVTETAIETVKEEETKLVDEDGFETVTRGRRRKR
jgi:pre-rRNA-processing protein TSR2